MGQFEVYIKEVRKSGRLYFTSTQAMEALGINANRLYVEIYKLKKSGDIISPAKGLYVIVPPEDQMMGSIPAEQLVPILMAYWHANYYAGLLTGAMYYGASHQKPQVFQVVSDRRSRPLICGRIKIEFIYKKSLADLPIKKLPVLTGYLNLASPELTAYDILVHHLLVGGLNNVATILSELIDAMTPEALNQFVNKIGQQFWVQRLGYILDSLDVLDATKKNTLLQVLQFYLKNMSLNYTPLSPDMPYKGYHKNGKWKIIENTNIESDI